MITQKTVFVTPSGSQHATPEKAATHYAKETRKALVDHAYSGPNTGTTTADNMRLEGLWFDRLFELARTARTAAIEAKGMK